MRREAHEVRGPLARAVAAWAKLETCVSALFGTEASEILPYLGTLLGLAVPGDLQSRVLYLDERAMGHQVLLTARRFFERLARQHPVVLVFDDLHWIDRSSAELLEHVMPLTGGVPLLLCLVMRPASVGAGTRLRTLAAERHPGRFTDIALGQLSTVDSQELVANLLQHAPSPGLQELILRKAEGNPSSSKRSSVPSSRCGRWSSIPRTVAGVRLHA